MTRNRRTEYLVCAALAVAGCVNVQSASGGQDSLRTVDIDLRIDTAKRGARISDKYVGLALSSKYINGLDGKPWLFDAAKNPGYAALVNLVREIGVKHIRMVSGDGIESTHLPSPSEDASVFTFAKDAGLGDRSLIYSLPVDSASGVNDTPATVDVAKSVWSEHGAMVESFALGNEPDCHWNNDPAIRGDANYKQAWEARYAAIQAGIPGSARVPFSGPDACSEGGEFLDDFVTSEASRISLATQHFYAANTTDVPAWQAGADYHLGDVVSDGNSAYKCIEAVSKAQTPPHDNHDAWVTAPALLSGEQLALGMLAPDVHDTFQKRYDSDLAGSSRWPSSSGAKLDYRWTEANAYGEGDKPPAGFDPANQLFALSLWSLDFFHWWAAHGSSGVDPFTDIEKFNSPIYQDPSTHEFVAEPYAYGMRAFAEGSQGMSIDPGAVTLSSAAGKWLSAYAVLGDGHLYVTLINRTFDRVGQSDAHVKIDASGFYSASARRLELASAPGASGDASVRSATLGGAKIPTSGKWAGTWDAVAVNHDGTVEVTVPATTAVILDLASP